MKQLMNALTSPTGIEQTQMENYVTEIISGHWSDIQITALLVGLKMKGETVDEMVGMASALRSTAMSFPRSTDSIVDTCGTGGAGKGTINVSTTTGLVAAHCGVRVAKHGNRSVSSNSGSSDFLQRLGFKIDCSPQTAAKCLEEHNFCFLFAPHYHPGIRHAMPVRTELKTRTLFNLVGPLVNPANPEIQLMGVYDPSRLNDVAQALHRLGCQRALVVNGGGLDEIALHDTTRVAHLNQGKIEEYTVSPEDAGLSRYSLSDLQIDDPDTIAQSLIAVLKGQGEPAHRDAIALNTAAILMLAEKAPDLKSGVTMALEALASGQVYERVQALAELTHAH